MSYFLRDIWIYPIKSTRGIRLERAQVEARGLAYDRRWMVVDAQGMFLTARTLPAMLQVETMLTADALVVSAPGMRELRVPLTVDSGSVRPVQVWKSHCQAISVGEEATAWWSEYLRQPCELVYLPPHLRRDMKPEYAEYGDGSVSFADAFPILVISQSSLDELNRRIGDDTPLGMERFRPNLVVEGCLPFDEDQWQSFKLEQMPFAGVKLCDRCVLTTIDPKTGVQGHEPLKTLATFRKHEGKVYLGQNVIALEVGEIAVGGTIEVLTRKDSLW